MVKSFPLARGHVTNSFQLVERLSGVLVESGHKLISLDVISLFTNIPIDLAINSVERRWNFIKDNCSISQPEFITAVKFILNSTYFTFNDSIYQQTYGTPMGSPLSPIIADIVLQDLEDKALANLKFTPSFYVRYVDDVALCVPSASVSETLNIFNSSHPRIQFTLEVGENDKLNFLDITLILDGSCLMFDWYHKPTFSGKYLNFLSQHPLCQKKGTIIGLTDRVFSLSHPYFHQKNFNYIVQILLDNNYPVNLLFQTIRERLKYLIDQSNKTEKTIDNNNDKPVRYFTVPFLPSVSEKFSHMVRGIDNVKISYFSLNKLNKFIKGHKEPPRRRYREM